jgi:hypothetical protein
MEKLSFFGTKKSEEFVRYPADPRIQIPTEFESVEAYHQFLDNTIKEFGVEPEFSFTINQGKIIVNQADMVELKREGENTYSCLGETIGGETQEISILDLPLAVVVGQGIFYIAKNIDDSIILYEPNTIDHQVKIHLGHSAMVGNMENTSSHHLKLSQDFIMPNHLMVKYKEGKIQIIDTSSAIYCPTRYYTYSQHQIEDIVEDKGLLSRYF